MVVDPECKFCIDEKILGVGEWDVTGTIPFEVAAYPNLSYNFHAVLPNRESSVNGPLAAWIILDTRTARVDTD